VRRKREKDNKKPTPAPVGGEGSASCLSFYHGERRGAVRPSQDPPWKRGGGNTRLVKNVEGKKSIGSRGEKKKKEGGYYHLAVYRRKGREHLLLLRPSGGDTGREEKTAVFRASYRGRKGEGIGRRDSLRGDIELDFMDKKGGERTHCGPPFWISLLGG